MKHRAGFVSNSSSSSFIVFGNKISNPESLTAKDLRSEREFSPFQWGVESESFLINRQFSPAKLGKYSSLTKNSVLLCKLFWHEYCGVF